MPTRPRRPAVKATKAARTKSRSTASRAPSRATARKAAEPVVVETPAPVVADAPVAPKAGKQKPVRDSFTMPPADHALIGQIKQRALALSHPA
jgi:hypothetical protein